MLGIFMAGKTTEELGRPQKPSTKKKIAEAMKGKKNPAYKDGRRSYRRLAGAKDNDGKLVHHRDGNRKNNKKSNLTLVSKKDRGKHDKAHHRENSFKKAGSGTKKGAHTKRSHPSKLKLWI